MMYTNDGSLSGVDKGADDGWVLMTMQKKKKTNADKRGMDRASGVEL